ncbi:MAG: AHH domain-containing protein [Saccharospirillaceae bacterium]|nr:AHH domain-containing protein [Pseudomonadales bacterium]NRB80382.1 AHH domain-containing protein [Saccharospirillaceae bacterium]
MKLVDGSVFNHQEILLIEDPSIAIRIISELSSTDFNALSKIGPSGREDWMTNPAVLAMAMRLGKVFLVQNSKNNVHKAALTFQEATSSVVEVFDGSTDAFHKNFKLNSELADTVKFSLKHLFKNATEPVNARDASASIGEEGANSQSSSQADDSEVEYNKGLGEKEDKQKTGSNSGSSSETDLGTDVAPATKTEEEKPKEDDKKCETCGKAYDENCPGSNPELKVEPARVVGKGKKLGINIMENMISKEIQESLPEEEWVTKHPWYYIGTSQRSIEAHHLIVSNVMKNSPEVKNAAERFSYSINHENNGVFLPYYMDLACYLEVPMHRSRHDNTVTDEVFEGKDKQNALLKYSKIKSKAKNMQDDEVFMPYPQAVAKLVRGILKDAKNKKSCLFENGKNKFIPKMDQRSNEIFEKIKSFVWTLTSDGKDYEPKNDIGCGNSNASSQEAMGVWNLKDKKGHNCAVKKSKNDHKFELPDNKIIIKRNLEIGK